MTASSLSKQLEALRSGGAAGGSAIQDTRRGGQQRPSLLFEQKKAADVDLYSIHQMAIGGLDELIDHEPRLEEFRQSLFSEESKSITRELQSREINQQIDANVQRYLRYLSPYANTEASLQTLEYLIRRYSIQQHSVEALIKCFLPYHDIICFGRVIRLLRLQSPGSTFGGASKQHQQTPWLFLHPLQEGGQNAAHTLPRATLVSRCLRDRTVLGLIFSTVQEAWEAGTLEHHPRLIALYGAVLLETLEKMGPVTEDAMRTILPPVLRAVRSGKAPTEYKVASYMILSKLSSTTSLSSAATTAILTTIAEGLINAYNSGASASSTTTSSSSSSIDDLIPRGLAIMVAVMYSQGLSLLPRELLRPLTSLPFLATSLLALAQHHRMVEGLLVPALLQALADSSTASSYGERLLSYLSILRPLPLVPHLLPTIILTLAQKAHQSGKEEEKGRLKGTLKEIQTREALSFDAAILQAKKDGVVSTVISLLTSIRDDEEETEENQMQMEDDDDVMGLLLADPKKRLRALEAIAKIWNPTSDSDDDEAEEEIDPCKKKKGKKSKISGDDDDKVKQRERRRRDIPPLESMLACLSDDDARIARRMAEWDLLGHVLEETTAVMEGYDEDEREGEESLSIKSFLRAVGRALQHWCDRFLATSTPNTSKPTPAYKVLQVLVTSLEKAGSLLSAEIEDEDEVKIRRRRGLIEETILLPLLSLLLLGPPHQLKTKKGGGEGEGEGGEKQTSLAVLLHKTVASALTHLPHPLVMNQSLLPPSSEEGAAEEEELATYASQALGFSLRTHCFTLVPWLTRLVDPQAIVVVSNRKGGGGSESMEVEEEEEASEGGRSRQVRRRVMRHVLGWLKVAMLIEEDTFLSSTSISTTKKARSTRGRSSSTSSVTSIEGSPSTATIESFAQALFPLIISLLSSTPTRPPSEDEVLPVDCLAWPLPAIVQRLPSPSSNGHQQGEGEEEEKDDPSHKILVSLLSLPPWAQALPSTQEALSHLLLSYDHNDYQHQQKDEERGNSHHLFHPPTSALIALAKVFASPPSSTAAQQTAQVQALSVAITLLEAMIRHTPPSSSTSTGSSTSSWIEGTPIDQLLPPTLIALCHPTKRVREGALLLLSTLVKPMMNASSTSSSTTTTSSTTATSKPPTTPTSPTPTKQGGKTNKNSSKGKGGKKGKEEVEVVVLDEGEESEGVENHHHGVNGVMANGSVEDEEKSSKRGRRRSSSISSVSSLTSGNSKKKGGKKGSEVIRVDDEDEEEVIKVEQNGPSSSKKTSQDVLYECRRELLLGLSSLLLQRHGSHETTNLIVMDAANALTTLRKALSPSSFGSTSTRTESRLTPPARSHLIKMLMAAGATYLPTSSPSTTSPSSLASYYKAKILFGIVLGGGEEGSAAVVSTSTILPQLRLVIEKIKKGGGGRQGEEGGMKMKKEIRTMVVKQLVHLPSASTPAASSPIYLETTEVDLLMALLDAELTGEYSSSSFDGDDEEGEGGSVGGSSTTSSSIPTTPQKQQQQSKQMKKKGGGKRGKDGKEEEEGARERSSRRKEMVVSFLASMDETWVILRLKPTDRVKIWNRLITTSADQGRQAEGGATSSAIATSRKLKQQMGEQLRLAAVKVMGERKALVEAIAGRLKEGAQHKDAEEESLVLLEVIQQAHMMPSINNTTARTEGGSAAVGEQKEDEADESSSVYTPLLPCLVDLLKRSGATKGDRMEMEGKEEEDNDDGGREYLQLLALETVSDLLFPSTPVSASATLPFSIDKSVDVQAILHLLETSPSLQVRNGAIKLLSHLIMATTSTTPPYSNRPSTSASTSKRKEGTSTKKVKGEKSPLKGVLEWLGRETLKQNDAYSFALVLRVIEGVLPTVAQRLHHHLPSISPSPPSSVNQKKSKKGNKGEEKEGEEEGEELTLLSIIQVFVQAWDDILPSRRLQLYNTLIRSLGEHSIGLVQMLLVYHWLTTSPATSSTSTITTTATTTTKKKDEKAEKKIDMERIDLDFLQSLASKVSPPQQVLSMADVIEIIRCVLQSLSKASAAEEEEEDDDEDDEGEGEGISSNSSTGRRRSRTIISLRARKDEEQPNLVDLRSILLPSSSSSAGSEAEPEENSQRKTREWSLTMMASSLLHLLSLELHRRITSSALLSQEDQVKPSTYLSIDLPTYLPSVEFHRGIPSSALLSQEDQVHASSSFQRGYLLIIEELLLLLRLPLPSKGKGNAGVRKAMDTLHKEASKILDGMHILLSTPSFVAIIQELIKHEDPIIRRRALQLFHHKMAPHREGEEEEKKEETRKPQGGAAKRLSRGEQHLIMEMLPELYSLIEVPSSSHSPPEEEDEEEEAAAAAAASKISEGRDSSGKKRNSGGAYAAIQQTVWASIAVLVESLGSAFAKSFLPAFDHLAQLTSLTIQPMPQQQEEDLPTYLPTYLPIYLLIEQSFLPVFDHLAQLTSSALQQPQQKGGEGEEMAVDNEEGECENYKEAQAQVLSSALLCAASTCHALGPSALPKLPTLLPTILDILSSESNNTTTTRDAALVSLIAITSSVPNFLNPFLPRIVSTLLHQPTTTTSSSPTTTSSSAPSKKQSKKAKGEEGSSVVRRGRMIQHALSQLASSTPLRLLFPVLLSAYRPVLEEENKEEEGEGQEEPASKKGKKDSSNDSSSKKGKGEEAVTTSSATDSSTQMVRLLTLFTTAIQASTRSDLLPYLPQMSSLFTMVMAYRSETRVKEEKKIVQVEEAICEAVVALVLRLNEEELRPFFLSLAHWKQVGESSQRVTRSRSIVFYRIVDALAEKLRGIFVPYFGYIWGDIQDELSALVEPAGGGSGGKEKKKEKKKKRKRVEEGEGDGEERGNGESSVTMIQLLLSALLKCFQYDDEEAASASETVSTSRFLTPTRFEGIMPLLVGLITGLKLLLLAAATASSQTNLPTYLELAESLLIPCLASMALTVQKDVLWKPFHHAVLMKTRDLNWEIRYIALRTLHETFVMVGEDYLAMLPESISYLSEALEDEEPRVVHACQAAVKYIEELSGESLESYLS